MKNVTKMMLTLSGAVLLAACAQTSNTQEQSLEEVYWTLTKLPQNELPVTTQDDPPHLLLSEVDKRVSGSTGCNIIMGTYEVDGQNIEFSSLATTMMACPHAATTEHKFLQALEQVDSWQMSGDELVLSSSTSDIRLTFSQVQN